MNRIFYGWYILLAVFIIYMLSSIGVSTLPLLNAQLKAIYGWSHEQVARPPSLLYFFISFVALALGSILDKVAPKTVILAGALCMIICLAAYYFVTQLWQLYAIYSLYSVALTCTGIMPAMILLNRWFVTYRGVAVGIFLMGSSVGGAIFPKWTTWMIEQYNWQTASGGLLLACIAFIVPPLFWIKNSPQQLGLLPDGKTNTSFHGVTVWNKATIATIGQAVREPLFYLLLFVTAAMWFCITALIQHLVYYMKDLHVDLAVSGTLLSVFFICSIFGKVIFGYLSDRFSPKYILLLASVSMVVGSLAWQLAAKMGLEILYAAAVIYGIGYSGTFTTIQIVLAAYYEGLVYGRLLGFFTMADTLAGSLGIYWLGYLRTTAGSYIAGMQTMVVLCVISTICILLMRKPDAEK
ncbi:MAG: MFS transporter [Cytophagales bacterium]|nr:MFS transporter [Bernardetiaceae bacterium]MDW8203804.1 MFS transporter [Cytophagales bacterium]